VCVEYWEILGKMETSYSIDLNLSAVIYLLHYLGNLLFRISFAMDLYLLMMEKKRVKV
jgi:hypothetical protein